MVKKRELSRFDVANRLETLLDELRGGTLHGKGDRTIDLPDRVRFGLDIEDDEIELKLTWEPDAVNAMTSDAEDVLDEAQEAADDRIAASEASEIAEQDEGVAQAARDEHVPL